MATALDPIAQRFDGLFRLKIAPHVASLEAERRRLRSRLVMTGGGFLIAAPIIAWVLWPLFPAWGLITGVIVAMVGLVFGARQQQRFRKAVRELVMPAICQAIEGVEHATGHAPGLPFDELEGFGLLPHHHRRRLDDVFSGRHRDTGFVMAEAQLLRRGSKNRMRTVFRGLVLAIDVPRDIPARILIARDAGRLGNCFVGWFRRFSSLERVPLPHEAFERRFELYSDRPEVARDTVGPALCDALVALADAHKGRPIQAAFLERRFFLTMPKRGDQFRLGSLLRPLDALHSDALKVLADVRIVHRVIDTLHGEPSKYGRARRAGAG